MHRVSNLDSLNSVFTKSNYMLLRTGMTALGDSALICVYMYSLHTVILYMSMYALHFLRTHENWTCYVIYVHTLLWMKGEILEPGYKTKQHCTTVLVLLVFYFHRLSTNTTRTTSSTSWQRKYQCYRRPSIPVEESSYSSVHQFIPYWHHKCRLFTQCGGCLLGDVEVVA